MEMAAVEELLRLEKELSSKPPDLDEVASWKGSRLWKWLRCTLMERRTAALEGLVMTGEPEANILRGQVTEMDQMLGMLDLLELTIKNEMENEDGE